MWELELLGLLRQTGDRGLSHAKMVAGLRGSDLMRLRARCDGWCVHIWKKWSER